MGFWVMFCIALAVSAIGFHKFVWFISLGYGFSMAAIGVALLVMFAPGASADAMVPLVMSALLVAYGLRLGGYLLVRERRSAAYNKVMKTQVNDGSGLGLPVQILVWGSCALLYACEAAPIYFRLANGTPADACAVVGAFIMVGGIVLESAADLQKTAQKRRNPHRFCDEGLFSFVRCPNYLGEVLTWTGVLVSGLTALAGPWQWLAAIGGYVAIVYVMFGGARRLELRQNRNYGSDPEYQAYVRCTPILLPFVPLYSVADCTWLKG
jgi:steroid 5-alpha reductase family enzyme